MRRIGLLVVLMLALLATASTVAAQSDTSRNFGALLSGAEEVPARATPANGFSLVHLNPDGTKLRFICSVADITNVVAAHIHMGPRGQNGPIVAFLYGPATPGAGPFSGILSQGTLTAEDLTGPLAGQSLDALMAQIRSGNAYVNVHTNDGIDPTNTGPGDFPGGEIRGQLQVISR
jgi:hypothetical protein